MGLDGQEKGIFIFAQLPPHRCSGETAPKGPTSKHFKKLRSPHTYLPASPHWSSAGAGVVQGCPSPATVPSAFGEDVCDALEADSTEIPLLCEGQKVSDWCAFAQKPNKTRAQTFLFPLGKE